MRLRHIEVFHAVYTSGSMTQAAEFLNVSQPSVSKVLAHAESQLGFQLFERAHGRLIATPEAERLIQPVANLFDSLGEVRRVAANLRDAGEGRVRVASTPALGLQILPQLVASYVREHPDTLFEIETLHHGEIATALIESRIDLGLAFEPAPTPGIAAQVLCRREIVLIAPQSMGLETGRQYTLEDIAGMPLIQLHSRSPLGNIIQARFETQNVAPQVVAVAETYHMAKSLVAQNLGVALVDEITARSAPSDGIDLLRVKPAYTFEVAMLTLADVPLALPCQRFSKHLVTFFSHNDSL
jgi:DNA-binding transcriptional LysR family regulator